MQFETEVRNEVRRIKHTSNEYRSFQRRNAPSRVSSITKNMYNKCNGASSFLGGVILGALVGAGVALLYAPQTGEETRKQLKVKADEAKKKGLALKKEALEKMDEVKDEAAEKVDEYKGKAKRAAKEFKSRGKA